MKFLATTFSPMMLPADSTLRATVQNATLAEVREALPELTSVVGHEVTAMVLSALLGSPVAFNRQNVNLHPGDVIWVVTPGFRANEAREFTREEVEAAGFRCFLVVVD